MFDGVIQLPTARFPTSLLAVSHYSETVQTLEQESELCTVSFRN